MTRGSDVLFPRVDLRAPTFPPDSGPLALLHYDKNTSPARGLSMHDNLLIIESLLLPEHQHQSQELKTSDLYSAMSVPHLFPTYPRHLVSSRLVSNHKLPHLIYPL